MVWVLLRFAFNKFFLWLAVSIQIVSIFDLFIFLVEHFVPIAKFHFPFFVHFSSFIFLLSFPLPWSFTAVLKNVLFDCISVAGLVILGTSIESFVGMSVRVFIFVDYFEKNVDILEVLEGEISHQVCFIDLFLDFLSWCSATYILLLRQNIPFIAPTGLAGNLVRFLHVGVAVMLRIDLNDFGLPAESWGKFLIRGVGAVAGWRQVRGKLVISIETFLFVSKHLLPTFRIWVLFYNMR